MPYLSLGRPAVLLVSLMYRYGSLRSFLWQAGVLFCKEQSEKKLWANQFSKNRALTSWSTHLNKLIYTELSSVCEMACLTTPMGYLTIPKNEQECEVPLKIKSLLGRCFSSTVRNSQINTTTQLSLFSLFAMIFIKNEVLQILYTYIIIC